LGFCGRTAGERDVFTIFSQKLQVLAETHLRLGSDGKVYCPLRNWFGAMHFCSPVKQNWKTAVSGDQPWQKVCGNPISAIKSTKRGPGWQGVIKPCLKTNGKGAGESHVEGLLGKREP
jgi:hypothetical protein